MCGDKSPGLMVTKSSSVTLDYHTDGDGWSRGWSLDYSTHSERQFKMIMTGKLITRTYAKKRSHPVASVVGNEIF